MSLCFLVRLLLSFLDVNTQAEFVLIDSIPAMIGFRMFLTEVDLSHKNLMLVEK